MNTTVIIIVVVITMIFGFWLIQHSQFKNEERKRLWELKRESQKTISPIRMRAYERLSLLLERTTPEHMIFDLRAKQPDALSTWTVLQMQQHLLQTIRIEFEHNLSQQVYVSEELWTLVLNARDQMAAFIIAIGNQLPKDATAQMYATTLITAYTSNGLTPTDKAMDELKREAKELL